MIEAAALGGQRTRVMLIPGLIAAGIGSLVSAGVGSLTGLSSSDYSLAALELPAFDTPTLADFAWTIVLAPAIAIVVAEADHADRMGNRATGDHAPVRRAADRRARSPSARGSSGR
jgi:hypothetical protein